MICTCVWRGKGVEEARGMGMHGRAMPAEARSGRASENLWNWSTGKQ